MNKSGLIDTITHSSDLKKVDVSRIVDAFTAAVTQSLKEGDTVTLVGFGTFSVRERAARIGRNPRTGEEIKIRATKVPTFKAGRSLKDAVN